MSWAGAFYRQTPKTSVPAKKDAARLQARSSDSKTSDLKIVSYQELIYEGTKSMSFKSSKWLNEPRHWSLEGERLQVMTDARTDFWRETHYGFTRDNGHFLGFDVEGSFTAQLRIKARYEALYDQAGIMVHLDEAHWIKAGLEWSDDAPRLGSVLTLGSSDWATGPFDGDAADFWLRVTVSAGVVRVQASHDGQRWPLLRLAPFPDVPTYRVGPMCCTPERAGLAVEFSDFSVGPPLGRELHDLS